MDGEHAFSAAIILVMVNVAFAPVPSTSTAMSTALHVLHGMAEKGNEHIRSRHNMLLQLYSTFTHADANNTWHPYAESFTPAAEGGSGGGGVDPQHENCSSFPMAGGTPVFTAGGPVAAAAADASSGQPATPPVADVGNWISAYENLDSGMDLYWDLFVDATRGEGEGFEGEQIFSFE